MIGTILKIISGVILSILLVMAFKEFISYKSLAFYRQQGAKVIFRPFVGLFIYYILQKGSKDQLEGIRELCKKNQNEDLLVFNYHETLMAMIIPLNKKILKEMYVRELEILEKTEVTPSFNFGFFLESGKEALHKRGIFSKFFHQENMKLIQPKIHAILDDHISKLKAHILSKTNESNKNEFLSIDFYKFINGFFDDVINLVVLGENKKILIKGRHITEWT